MRAACTLLVAGLLAASPAWARTFDDCERGVQDRPAESLPWRCFFDVGLAGRALPEAARRLDSHRALDPHARWARYWHAQVLVATGDPRATEEMRRTAESCARAADPDCEVAARIVLDYVLRTNGEVAAATGELSSAEQVARKSGRADLLSDVAVRQARAAMNDGDYAHAERLLRESERSFTEDFPPRSRLRVLDTLGDLLYTMGRHVAAASCYRRAIELARGLSDAVVEAQLTADLLGVARMLQRNSPGADSGEPSLETLAREALAVADAVGEPLLACTAHAVLGDVLGGAEGNQHYRQAVEVARASASVPILQSFLMEAGAGMISNDPASPAEGFRLLEEARELCRSIEDRMYFLDYLSSSRLHTGPREAAIRESLELLDTMDELRSMQDDTHVRARTLGHRAYAYRRLVGYLLRGADATPSAEDIELAFATLERLHARLLLDTLDAAGVAPVSGHAEFPTTSEVRAVLADDEALITFQIAPAEHGGGSWALVLDREAVRPIPLGEVAELRAKVNLFLGLIERRDGEDRQWAAHLGALLLEPILRDLPPQVTRLAIVPDEFLWGLPFEALRLEPSGETVAERYGTSIVPSATVLVRWRTAGDGPVVAPVVSFADPQLPSAEDDTPSTERAWALREAVRLGPLPRARREARALVERLGHGSRLLAGAEATEEMLKHTGLRDYAIVHLAAHALVDEDRPERSAVLLAKGPGAEDGLLQAHEIAGLDLRGRIVLLSACRSAAGAVVAGEGPLSLAHAFFQAGARAVVGSLWSLRDDDAEALVSALSAHLARGATVAEAMAAARRERIRASAPTAAWAGLIVIGDGAAAPVPREWAASGSPIFGATLAALTAAAAIVLVWLRVRRTT